MSDAWWARLSAPSTACVHEVEDRLPRDVLEDLYQDGFAIAAAQGPFRDDRALLRAIAESFRFPDYFGGNWDALDDCLADPSWWPAEGYVLVVQDVSDAMFSRLASSWRDAAALHAPTGVAFHLVRVV